MEKINLVEILKDCPTGMELDCTMIDNVVFEKLDFSSSHHPIIIRRTDSNTTIHLTKYGQYSDEEDYKCIIFPKGKTTWEGFVSPCKFKDGDILYCNANDYGEDKDMFKYIFIFDKIVDGMCYCSHCHLYGSNFYDTKTNLVSDYSVRLATEEEKERLFKAIKDNGCKWNEETKTLENLVIPKFKVGDKIKHKGEKFKDERTITSYGKSGYWTSTNEWVVYRNQDDWELVPMESKIKWRRGCPEQSGNYIVTMSIGEVTVKEFYNPHTSRSYWEGVEENDEVIAWCKLSDIEPYKE